MSSPILAAIFSFFIPGLGQFFEGHFMRGFFIFIFSIIMGVVAFFVLWIGPLFAFLVWIWNIVDAYKLAEKNN
jgi:hypothetical protein